MEPLDALPELPLELPPEVPPELPLEVPPELPLELPPELPDDEPPEDDDEEDESDELDVLDFPSVAPEDEVDSDFIAFFRDSDGESVTYHPPPFKMNGAGERSRWTGPPQTSHVVSAGSEMRCRISNVRGHLGHSYS